MPSLPTGSTPRPLPNVIPPRSYNRVGLYLAFAIAAACIPFTLKFQQKHEPNMANRRWQMLNLYGVTGTEAVKRFGPPTKTRDFSLTEGSIFAGQKVGFKKFYLPGSPEYNQHVNDPVVWKFPQYSMIREMTWKLPDSLLTVWLHEPRAILDLSGGEDTQIYLPSTADGEWVALDNYRLGNDFLAKENGAK